MKNLLDTENYDSIYNSLINILSISRNEIVNYAITKSIEWGMKFDYCYSDNNSSFYKWILNKIDDTAKTKLKYITIFNFSRRLEKIKDLKNLKMLNINDLCGSENSLTQYLKNYDITFSNCDSEIHCYYKDYKLDFSDMRDRFKDDPCINGFLLGGKIYNDSNISHLKYAPELLQDIQKAINKIDDIDICEEYYKRSTAYIFKLKVPVKNLIFDECYKFNELDYNYTLERIYGSIGDYIVNQVLYRGYNNPMVRIRDNDNISKSNILKIYKVSDEELFKY